MKDVHIVTVGFDPLPSLDLISCGMPIDHVYLLNDRSEIEAIEAEKYIINALRDTKTIKIDTKLIDCLDYQDVFDSILEIADEETSRNPGCRIHINFSRGTAIVVGAACNAACEIENCDLYYSRITNGKNIDLPASERIIHVDLSSMSAYHELKGETKNVFFYFINARDGHLTNQELISLSNLDKSTLTYHTKKLSSEKMALIKRDSNSKVIDWVLTDTGRRVLRRLKNESKKTN